MCNRFCFVFSSSVFHSLYWSIFGYFYYFCCWFYIPSLKAALLFFIIVSIRFTVSMSSFNCKEDTISQFPVFVSHFDRKLDTISRFPISVSSFTHEKFLSLNKKTNSCMNSG